MSPDASTTRCVVVVEWTDRGHHLTYLRFYTRALLTLGCRVVVVSPDAAGLAAWWAGEGGLDEATRARAASRALPVREFSIKRERWRDHWRRKRYFADLRAEVAAGEAAVGARATQVFFSCIYEREAAWVLRMADGLGRPWGGLYMQAEAFRGAAARVATAGEEWWRRPEMAGLLTLDEEYAPRIAEATGKVAVAAPDLVDATLAEADATAERVERFRAGRPLVGLLGHLQATKGVLTLAEVAAAPESAGYAFLFAGEMAWERFTAEEAAYLRRVLSDGGRVLFLEGRIADEAGYNRLVAGCDVLFAAYHDFPHSSNTLGKAAAFAKPVIVSDGHLMARRVREFRLGEVVPQRDARAVLAALGRIDAASGPWSERGRPRWADYLAVHGEGSLRTALAEYLRGTGG